MRKVSKSTNMPALGGMGARLNKPEKPQGINRSYLIKIPHYIQMYLKKNLLPFPARLRTGCYYPKQLIANNCRETMDPVPEQGQFHVSLNAVEDTVVIFQHDFDKLFSCLFRIILPNRPQPHPLMSQYVTTALLGWLLVHEI